MQRLALALESGSFILHQRTCVSAARGQQSELWKKKNITFFYWYE